jgi:hypothetical protein
VSPLTKVFVVLVTVLSVVLVALVVPFVANTENYKAKLAVAQSDRDAASARAKGLETAAGIAAERDAERVANLVNENRLLTTQRNEYANKLGDISSSLSSERASKGKADADVSRLSASNAQLTSITAALQTELSLRRKENEEKQATAIAQADQIRDLEGAKETLSRQVRSLQQQVVAVQDRSKTLEDAMARLDPSTRAQIMGGEQTGGPEFEASTPILGKITAVQRVAEDTFVQINVGKNDGVQANMKFLVHRGNQFLGTLVITTVDGRAAAGRLRLSQGDIVAGDAVLSGSN